jgi:nicotinate-nucleotide--dimethylbenzimidazole phosphoribosyltransferase
MPTLKEQLQHKIDSKTKPAGSLGQLEHIALQIGMIQQTLSPKIEKPTLLVFAADHGLSDERVSLYPKEVTWQMVMNFVSGGAAINVFCRKNGINLKMIDAGVDYDFPEGTSIINAKIKHGSCNMRKEPAMSIPVCELAMQKGTELVKKEAEAGCNTIGFGEMGIANTSSSSLLMHWFTGISVEECTGSGTGVQGAGLMRKIRILEKISKKYSPKTPLETLATFGGLEIAMMTGAMLEAYRQKMIILIDGFIATASILTAKQFIINILDSCIFCHTSQEQGHEKLLKFLGVDTVLNLGMRLGEGTATAAALPIIELAIAFLNEMASFEEAGVSDKE